MIGVVLGKVQGEKKGKFKAVVTVVMDRKRGAEMKCDEATKTPSPMLGE